MSRNPNASKNASPIALIILDGFGSRQSTKSNAIAMAHTPTLDSLFNTCPHTTLSASGLAVGLPEGQMGNSEVGHLTLGAGRVIPQDLTRIDESIQNSSFSQHPLLKEAFETLKKNQGTLHVLGLLSPGGVHSHENHLHALLQAAKKHQINTIVHAFLDGRDTPPTSAMSSIKKLESFCDTQQKNEIQGSSNGSHTSLIRIGTLCGRYYAMDRDKRFERSQKAYDLLTQNTADYHATTAEEALNMAYQRGETDEFVQPTVVGKEAPIQTGDGVIFMNFRSDRARQLSFALTQSDFQGFKRAKIPTLRFFITLTEYAPELRASVLFPSLEVTKSLSEILANSKKSQLRIAETEKYAHVTYFFNAGRETPYPGEDRILIPSPKVSTYDLAPEMSADAITDQLVDAIQKKQYEVIICNFANADMLGHTGNLEATIQSIETLDRCLKRIIDALSTVGGEALITADHGNAEMMFDDHHQQPHTAHTNELVPFLYFGRPAHITHEQGTLADVAPTMLYLLGLPIPSVMTGKSLLAFDFSPP